MVETSGGSGTHELAELIARNRERIVEMWRRRVTGSLDPDAAPTSELIDSLPVFLGELVAQLRAAGAENPGDAGDPIATAVQHGSQRFHAGFSLGTVVREYRVLQDCIFRVVEESCPALPVEPLRLVTNGITSAIADAVEAFAKDRDEALTRERVQHLAFVAHELRNPLSTAQIAFELLRRELPAPPPRSLERAQRGLQRVRTLIDKAIVDVRLLAVATESVLRREELDLLAVVRDTVADVADDVQAKNITVTIEGESVIVSGDRTLLDSAMSNLVRNAIKFTPADRTIIVRLRSGEGRASVQVQDHCGGLPPGKTEELFTPFVQKGEDRTGFGLGLAITKQAIEAHDGSIQVLSLPGQGCVFMFDLPLPGARSPG